jgi:hypothetical protein
MRRAACSHGPKETSLVEKTGTASERRAGAETLLEQDPSHRLKYPAQKTDTSQHLCGIRRGTGNLGRSEQSSKLQTGTGGEEQNRTRAAGNREN